MRAASGAIEHVRLENGDLSVATIQDDAPNGICGSGIFDIVAVILTAGVADKIMGHTIPMGPGILDFTVREPIGVSAQIVPWNYPIQIGSRGVAPALAAGCAVVMKPSSEAPMTAIALTFAGMIAW